MSEEERLQHFGPAASFWTQTDAMLRKNLTDQKRNGRTNCRLVCFPFFLCIILAVSQALLHHYIKKNETKCDSNTSSSDANLVNNCPVPKPPQWPALMQVPEPRFRAVRNDIFPSMDLPDESCRLSGSCPATVLCTGNNRTVGQILSNNMFANPGALNPSDDFDNLANLVLGSSTISYGGYLDPNFDDDNEGSLYVLKDQCSKEEIPNAIPKAGVNLTYGATCAQVLSLWRNSSSDVNRILYEGYARGNSQGKINEILAAYDFLNSDDNGFRVNIWYNSTYTLQVLRSVNVASNAFLQFLRGHGTKVLFDFVKELPRPAAETTENIDLTFVIGPLFFTWAFLQLFPVVLTSLVYEKEQRLRIMMKMHGLGDGPYQIITYAYFLLISLLYILVFWASGSAIGLNFFIKNDNVIQFAFYFIYINLQVSVGFLLASFFTNLKTASVSCYLIVFGTGLLGEFIFRPFIEDESTSRTLTIVLELYPGFSLYRGLYELSQYMTWSNGMELSNLKDQHNGMTDVLIIMVGEWFLLLLVASCKNQLLRIGRSIAPFRKDRKKQPSFSHQPSLQRQGSEVLVDQDKPDVYQEMEKVEQLLLEPTATHTIISDNLRKVYPGRDGNPEKLAVKGVSLALPRGECFGMLGPNGAGKTSFISMMIGLTNPTSGTAYVEGLDIRKQMDRIYTSMGVCPQHDLLWETLTGREHLLFYGRLKNLKGSNLKREVEESLKGVDLYNGGVPDKQVRKYSGGMKRRLSVAISLIGNPKVVYLDEPSTGLDPASRRRLWNVLKRAKQDRAIILTTHSMEEAEFLCDRIGVFVNGSLHCIGNPKQLKARYGGFYVLTMTTSLDHEQEVVDMVKYLSPTAERTYQTSGTQKFELLKGDVRVSDVFQAVKMAKSRFPVLAWGLSDTTLEDVFIKIATRAD